MTLKELAEKIGYSKTTISAILNNREKEYGLSPQTVNEVREKIKEFGFTPSYSGQLLSTGKSMLIGLVAENMFTDLFGAMYRELERRLRERQYFVIIINVSEGEDCLHSSIDKLLDIPVDGLIVRCPDAIVRKKCRQKGKLLISLEDTKHAPVVIKPDDAAAGKLAAEHFIQKGCCKPAILKNAAAVHGHKLRYAALRKVFAAKRIKTAEIPFGLLQDSNQKNTARLRSLLFHKNNTDLKIDAIFGDDVMCARMIKCLNNMKIKIPQQVKVLGCNNSPWTDMLDIPLSSIDFDFVNLGGMISEYLLANLENATPKEAGQKCIYSTPKIVARASG